MQATSEILQIKINTTLPIPVGFEQMIADEIESILDHASVRQGNQQDFFAVEVTGQATASAKWDDRYSIRKS